MTFELSEKEIHDVVHEDRAVGKAPSKARRSAGASGDLRPRVSLLPGVDRFDLELVRSCYHDDATDHHAGFEGGPDEFVAWLSEHLGPLGGTMHVIANHLVELDGDIARAETYVNAHHWPAQGCEDPSKVFVTGSRYVDRLSRREGVWKIDQRQTVRSWSRSDQERFTGGNPDSGPVGRRGKSDPIYHI